MSERSPPERPRIEVARPGDVLSWLFAALLLFVLLVPAPILLGRQFDAIGAGFFGTLLVAGLSAATFRTGALIAAVLGLAAKFRPGSASRNADDRAGDRLGCALLVVTGGIASGGGALVGMTAALLGDGRFWLSIPAFALLSVCVAAADFFLLVRSDQAA